MEKFKKIKEWIAHLLNNIGYIFTLKCKSCINSGRINKCGMSIICKSCIIKNFPSKIFIFFRFRVWNFILDNYFYFVCLIWPPLFFKIKNDFLKEKNKLFEKRNDIRVQIGKLILEFLPDNHDINKNIATIGKLNLIEPKERQYFKSSRTNYFFKELKNSMIKISSQEKIYLSKESYWILNLIENNFQEFDAFFPELKLSKWFSY